MQQTAESSVTAFGSGNTLGNNMGKRGFYENDED